MELKNDYADSMLLQPGNPYCPARIFAPCDELVFTMEQLPDLSMHVSMCFSLWGDVPELLYSDSSVAILVNLVQKAMPIPCMGRSLIDILDTFMETERTRSTLLIQVFGRIIIASLLGILPAKHTRVCASFALRRVVYQHFVLQLGQQGEYEFALQIHTYSFFFSEKKQVGATVDLQAEAPAHIYDARVPL